MAKYKVMDDLLRSKSVISHIFMNQIHETKWFENMKLVRPTQTKEEIEAETVEIKLTVNGEELDLKKTLKRFEEQVDSWVTKEATELVKERTSEKFMDISNKLEEYRQITDQWAEDINWNYDYNINQFGKETNK